MSDDEYGVLDEGSIFRALTDHGVDFVVVGGGAALLCGAVRPTRDIDCVAQQTTENHRRRIDARVDGPPSFADRGSR
jgi:hypothetical protein